MLKVNPEFKELIPPITAEEREGLEQSIIAEGCRDAIVVWGDTIIDGHNRHEICLQHGIKFQTVERELEDADAAKVWIIDNQMARRNLPAVDRVLLQEQKSNILKAKAKIQQGTRTDILTNSSKCLEPINTRKEIAKAAKVAEDTVRKVGVIKNKAPEKIDSIRKGHDNANYRNRRTKNNIQFFNTHEGTQVRL